MSNFFKAPTTWFQFIFLIFCALSFLYSFVTISIVMAVYQIQKQNITVLCYTYDDDSTSCTLSKGK